VERVISTEFHFETSEDWLDVLRDWASAEPRVLRVWIFGSRATGVRRQKEEALSEPDLDVAYELRQVRKDETTYTAAHFRNDGWRDMLQARLPVALDLQFMITDQPDAMVPKWVAEHGKLIWERSIDDEKPAPGEGSGPQCLAVFDQAAAGCLTKR